MRRKARKLGGRPPRRRTRQRRSLWTPAKGISQSALTKFLNCPEQFALSYVEGMTSRHLSVPLEFGTMFHLCCEHQEKGTPEAVASTWLTKYLTARKKSINPAEYDKLQQLAGTAQVLFPAYVRHHAKKDKEIRWLSRESQFSVPYQSKEGLITLHGKRDGVFRNKTGGLCLFETKTKSQINDAEIHDGLRADFQTLFYALSLKLEFGEEPKEILYNVVRRPGQKFLKNDTLPKYLARIATDIKKRPDHYFRRWRVTLADGTLENFSKCTLDNSISALLRWWASVKKNPFDRWTSPYHLLNLNALFTKYGRCDLYELIIQGRQAGYFVRKATFPELSKSLTTEAA